MIIVQLPTTPLNLCYIILKMGRKCDYVKTIFSSLELLRVQKYKGVNSSEDVF